MPAIPWTSFGEVDAEDEYLVMASRLPLRSYLRIPLFVRLTLVVRRQLAGAEGLVGYSLLAEPLSKTFWTLSAWRDEAALDRFARELPHVDVMRRLRPHMGRTAFVTWRANGRDLPISWAAAKAALAEQVSSPAPVG